MKIESKFSNGEGGRLSSLAWHMSALANDRAASRKVLPAVLAVAGMTSAAALLVFSQPSLSIGRAEPRMIDPANQIEAPKADLMLAISQSDQANLLTTSADATKAALGLSKPLVYGGDLTDKQQAVDCLATAAWYEAGDDPAGQRAVIQVVLNRLRHPAFPKTVCGVVFQGSERKTGCQFSFTCDGSLMRRYPSTAAWSRARTLGEDALNGAVDTDVRQATHFHADYVTAWWTPGMQMISKVGSHIFYRWPGGQGALSAKNLLFAREQAPVPIQDDKGPLGQLPGQDQTANLTIDDGGDVSAEGLFTSTSIKAPTLPPNRATLMQFDPASPSGRWAMTALDSCSGKASCQIVGYGLAEQVEQNKLRPSTAMDRPLFLFVRDKASGMDLALWDCGRVQRPSAAQCLPDNGAELTSLLQSR